MNTLDWLSESAKYMAQDRPDIYTVSSAIDELSRLMESLRNLAIAPVASMMFTSYVLTRIVEEDMEEFMLSRKLTGLCIFEQEEVVQVFAYEDSIGLPSVLDDQDWD